jgi:hypothetical protein
MLDPCIPTCIVELLVLVIGQLNVLIYLRVIIGLLLELEERGDVDALFLAFMSTRERSNEAFEVFRGDRYSILGEDLLEIRFKNEVAFLQVTDDFS